MSRIGRAPISIPNGVQVNIHASDVVVKGPKGELRQTFPSQITVAMEGDTLRLERPSDEPKMRSLHGLSRALLNNMVVGVSQGFEKMLQVEGVGYRAEMSGTDLLLNVGFSHPVRIAPPAGISFEVEERARTIKVTGADKAQVGQVAADIRKVRPPEPYKGKGIRYSGEYVRHKAGKAGKVG